ncbi:phytochrome-like protein [Pholiota conissans]|uniref:Phytochrome-like protein n=1 Tax=Pholiota conissans TaxID=109636 RepID=A0A9P5ZFU9_9AGAR|nr:phytochrome-like protein [Pholiota conissans]
MKSSRYRDGISTSGKSRLSSNSHSSYHDTKGSSVTGSGSSSISNQAAASMSPQPGTSFGAPSSNEQSKQGSMQVSSNEDTGSSLTSDEPHTTFKYRSLQDENRNHVVIGREGKLQRCEDEACIFQFCPIRTPGAVQGFGVLVAVHEIDDTLVVRQVSENSSELLGLPPHFLFGLECFTDTLPESQVGVLWDNIEFLTEPSQLSEEDEFSPDVFLLSGYGAPGSALPNEPNSVDGRKIWTCWCAIHRSQALHNDVASSGLIVMEFELERDVINPLYPPAVPSETSTIPSPIPSSSTAGKHTPASKSTQSLPLSSKDTEIRNLSPLFGLEGDEEWQPLAEDVLKSTTSQSRPLPALERLRRMRRQPVNIHPLPSNSRRSRRQASRGSSSVGMMDVLAVMTQISEQLGTAPDLETYLKVVVGVIKDLTLFHRVMVYQFDEMWNGQVVAELVDWSQSHDLFMGLHFPAGDIPAQARRLYELNKVRLLYNAGQPTARIVVRSIEDLKTPLNMTHCFLRAMSPIHIHYLENMGVRASMSVSIMAFGQLWGLINCHTYGTHGMRVSFPVRQMLRLLSQAISRSIERLSFAQRLHTRKLINTMASDHHPTGYIVSNADDLLGLFDADFGILVIGEGAKILGPNQYGQEILIMAEYLRLKQYDTIQASQAVAKDFPDLELTAGFEIIAGLLYVPLSSSGKDFIAFLRRGQPHEVRWAGRPYKEAKESKLEPRASFKIWAETIAGRSRIWTNEQLETAAVLALVYGKFIEVWREKENALQTTRLTNLLLSNATHEVRTPLNHIINYLEMAMNGPLDGETRDNLSKSHAASKSLLFTINDLLDLTRLEIGNETSFNEPFDLHSAIKEATHLYRKEAARRNISFNLDLIRSPTDVVGDGNKIRTVVQNLTANALKYTSNGSITVSCTTFGEPEGLRNVNQTAVEIRVADSGCGIRPDKLESIFREFEQVQSSEPKPHSEAGVGLGLAVVARIVEQLGGQLRVESTVGEGSSFSFLIPLTLSIERNLSRHGRSSRSSGSSTSLRSGSIGEKDIDSLVEALSSSHMKLEGPLTVNKSRRPSAGVFEVAGSQVPVRPVKIHSLDTEKPLPKQSFPISTEEGPNSRLLRASTPPYISAEKPPHGKLRVLIVEDNDLNRTILTKRLTMDGHLVDSATNGQEGLDKVATDYSFDAVLMDIQMPILNGFEATRKIRDFEKELNKEIVRRPSHTLNGRIPIFAVSASLFEHQREELAGHGIDGWILKPIDFKRLAVILKGVIDPIQRQNDIYRPGCSWEKGGWLRDVNMLK